VVQALPSEHGVPSAEFVKKKQSPLTHLPVPVLQGLGESVQVFGVPTQFPFSSHLSEKVHKSPSSQVAPTAILKKQVPVVESQTPGCWHKPGSPHFTTEVALQTPEKQTEEVTHLSAMKQEVPSTRFFKVQTPSNPHTASLQISLVKHVGFPLQTPALQISESVQRLPSSQEEPSERRG